MFLQFFDISKMERGNKSLEARDLPSKSMQLGGMLVGSGCRLGGRQRINGTIKRPQKGRQIKN